MRIAEFGLVRTRRTKGHAPISQGGFKIVNTRVGKHTCSSAEMKELLSQINKIKFSACKRLHEFQKIYIFVTPVAFTKTNLEIRSQLSHPKDSLSTTDSVFPVIII